MAYQLLRTGYRLGATVVVLFATASSAPAQEAQWISLFNGEDLTGWTPKIRGHAAGENWNNTFRVENGELRTGYDQYDQFGDAFGHLFFETPYSSYDFRLEYRFLSEQCPGGPDWAFRNSGVMIHSEPPQSMRVNQEFPVSIEVQLLGGWDDSDRDRTTGNLCTPGTNVVMKGELVTRHCTNSDSATFRGDDWVTLHIEVRGHEVVRHYINDDLVLDYTEPQMDPRDEDGNRLIDAANGEKKLEGGYIALQSESHPVAFREISLLPITE